LDFVPPDLEFVPSGLDFVPKIWISFRGIWKSIIVLARRPLCLAVHAHDGW
jgi:hypothetical protein